MVERPRRSYRSTMGFRLASAAPLFAFDEDLTIVAWNQGAEELTGISAAAAVGQPCWAVLAGRHDSGALMCHRHCSRARYAREGRPVQTEAMNIAGSCGPRRIEVDTVSVNGNGSGVGVFLHLMRDAPAATGEQQARDLGLPPDLTPRQLDVLRLLAEGAPARAIASTLGIAEATVRNHIRAILLELGAHSQLEAVFRAREHDVL